MHRKRQKTAREQFLFSRRQLMQIFFSRQQKANNVPAPLYVDLILQKEQYQKVFDITQYLKNNKTDIYILQTGNDRYVKTAKIDEVAAIIPNLKSYTKIKGGGHRMEDNKINAIKSILDDL